MKAGAVISEELLVWRKANDFSREDASEILGVSPVSLRHWETGRSCGMYGPLRKLIEIHERNRVVTQFEICDRLFV